MPPNRQTQWRKRDYAVEPLEVTEARGLPPAPVSSLRGGGRLDDNPLSSAGRYKTTGGYHRGRNLDFSGIKDVAKWANPLPALKGVAGVGLDAVRAADAFRQGAAGGGYREQDWLRDKPSAVRGLTDLGASLKNRPGDTLRELALGEGGLWNLVGGAGVLGKLGRSGRSGAPATASGLKPPNPMKFEQLAKAGNVPGRPMTPRAPIPTGKAYTMGANHYQIGKNLGYSPADIAAFYNHLERIKAKGFQTPGSGKANYLRHSSGSRPGTAPAIPVRVPTPGIPKVPPAAPAAPAVPTWLPSSASKVGNLAKGKALEALGLGPSANVPRGPLQKFGDVKDLATSQSLNDENWRPRGIL